MVHLVYTDAVQIVYQQVVLKEYARNVSQAFMSVLEAQMVTVSLVMEHLSAPSVRVQELELLPHVRSVCLVTMLIMVHAKPVPILVVQHVLTQQMVKSALRS